MRRYPVLLAMMAWLAGAVDAAAVTITSPAAGASVAPGTTLSVVAAPSPGETFVQVLFLVAGGDPVTAPGLTGTVQIPLEAVGPLPIGVAAVAADGTVSTAMVTVNVTPGALRRLTLALPPALVRVGQVVQADVRGLFADGVTRDLSGADRGTTYTSSDTAVLGVHASGVLQARTRGTAVVTVSNRGRTAQVTVNVRVPDPLDNGIPVPDAGGDQAAPSGTRVNLSAAASSDPDGDVLTYRWTQMAGPLVLLWNATSAQAHFVTPTSITQPTLIEFSLVVIDAKGATSFPDTVRVTVSPGPAQ